MITSKFACLVFIEMLDFVLALSDNPYDVLGLEKYATAQDIKKTYKHLAKIWHPDKNEHPEATKAFVKMKQAYELLSDAGRRRLYDQYGIYNDEFHYTSPKSYIHTGQTSSDQFEKQFNTDNDINFYHKISITTNNFETNVIPKSQTEPFILIFYNDWCFRCIRLIGAFNKLIRTLEPLGICFAAVNAANEPLLVKRMGIIDIPSLVIILDGRSYIYRGEVSKLDMVQDFIRKKLPHTIATKIYDNNADLFLEGWTDNRVRALFFEPRNRTRLRYLISAYTFQRRVAFGFIQLNNSKSAQIQNRYKVDPKLDTLLIFKEDIGRPFAMVSLPAIPVLTLNKIISSNQYLMLPRLSSQIVMEDICPVGWNQRRKRLCVILITENNDPYNYDCLAFRNIAGKTGNNIKRARFTFMFKEKQSDFVNAITKGASEDQHSQIVIIWRRDRSHIKYEWISGIHLDRDSIIYVDSEHAVNATMLHITNTIHRLLKPSEEFRYDGFVQNLVDEHAQTAIDKWLTKFQYICEYLVEKLETEHILAILSLIGTILFMLGVGYIMISFVRAEERSLKDKGHDKGINNLIKPIRNTPELRLHELRAEKYNGMVRLLKPGCRTIILLTDLKTRPKLIPSFHKAVWPYRKSKALLFGYMLLEKGLVWYSELLRLSLYESTALNINPRNCVGTVIAINGHRKYFCMYHAKHSEKDHNGRNLAKLERHKFIDIIGAETSTFAGADTKILLEENLLDGLSNWLDRLFEGSSHRYHINYWPEFPMK